MASIFFSHSYREPDREINEHYLKLLQLRGFVSSIDVPSPRLNSAKLERQLGFTKGLFCVLPWRADGPTPDAPYSPHIMYEIMTGVRSGRPVLVFAEDRLPNGLFPRQVVEERFSRTSFWRDTPEHLQAIDHFQYYVGKTPLPRVRITNRKRYVMLVGFSGQPKWLRSGVQSAIARADYHLVEMEKLPFNDLGEHEHYSLIRGASLLITLLDNLNVQSSYFVGFARAALIPTIALHRNEIEIPVPSFPFEYGPRKLPLEASSKKVADVVKAEMDIFQDEAIAIDRKEEINKYTTFIDRVSKVPGVYDATERITFINQYRGDFYNVGEAGSVGAGATYEEKQ